MAKRIIIDKRVIVAEGMPNINLDSRINLNDWTTQVINEVVTPLITAATALTPVTFVTFTDSPYSASWGEDLEVDSTAGDVVIQMPQSVGNDGETIQITRIDGTANLITVNTFAGELLNGAASFTDLITIYDSLTARANDKVSYRWR